MRPRPRRAGAGGDPVSAAITLGDAVTALVAEKRAAGYKYDAEEKVLARFAAFCRAEFPGAEAPDRACVEAWIAAARRRGVKPATLQGLAAPVRELARWLGRRGVSAYVLPPRALPRPARYVPHIYTGQELAALFAQTDRCRYCSQVPFRHLVMPVLFRVIYACGLRGPAAALRRRRPCCWGAADPRQGRQGPAGTRQRGAAPKARRIPRPGRRAHRRGLVLPRQHRAAADAQEHLQELPPVPVAGPDLPRRQGPRPSRPRSSSLVCGQQCA